MKGLLKLTRHNVSCVHGILVFNEAEAIHELDLGNLAMAMRLEVVLNVLLGGCAAVVSVATPVKQTQGIQGSQRASVLG